MRTLEESGTRYGCNVSTLGLGIAIQKQQGRALLCSSVEVEAGSTRRPVGPCPTWIEGTLTNKDGLYYGFPASTVMGIIRISGGSSASAWRITCPSMKAPLLPASLPTKPPRVCTHPGGLGM